MNYKVAITDKDGFKYTFKRIIENITIDRRLSMQTSSATIVIQDVLYQNKKLYDFTGIEGIIANGNKIQIYISDDNQIDKIQFTGIIREFSPADDNETITIEALDVACKILRPIDGGIPVHIFNNITATNLINDLVKKAGLGNVYFNFNNKNDYIIKNLKMQYDVQISDIIDQALATMDARARILKNGLYYIEDLYPNYKREDVNKNRNYDFVLEDFIKISNIKRARKSATLYNRVLIRFNDNIYDVFEEPAMLKYVGYSNFKEIDAPLADTKVKRQRIASKFFLDCWRENTNLEVVATQGNPDIEIGKIVRLILNKKVIGHYLITGIRTELTPENFIDIITLDGMREAWNIAKLSTGNYTLKK